ncbi:Thiohydrolase [Fusarium oxysporum f. sp. albedinis]|nr:Thiohydrolase [Fusarium oxysporum f. sp. albedinis]
MDDVQDLFRQDTNPVNDLHPTTNQPSSVGHHAFQSPSPLHVLVTNNPLCSNQNGAVLNRFSPRHADLRGCRSQADADQLLQRHQMQVIFRSIRCDLGTKHLCRKTNCYNYHYESSMLIAECQARGWLCNIYKSRDCNDYLDQMRYTGDFKCKTVASLAQSFACYYNA